MTPASALLAGAIAVAAVDPEQLGDWSGLQPAVLAVLAFGMLILPLLQLQFLAREVSPADFSFIGQELQWKLQQDQNQCRGDGNSRHSRGRKKRCNCNRGKISIRRDNALVKTCFCNKDRNMKKGAMPKLTTATGTKAVSLEQKLQQGRKK